MAESLNKDKATQPVGDQSPAARKESVSISDIEKLFSLMRDNDIAELEIEQYKTKIHIVSKGAPANAQQQPMMHYMPAGMQHMQMMPMQNQPQGNPESQPAAAQQPAQSAGSHAASDQADTAGALPPNARTVLSPMVGTFYRSPSPEAGPFVKEGDAVNEETVLCIIEAMKLMNEIKAETRGKIVRVLVEDGMPVEFNQPLFLLD